MPRTQPNNSLCRNTVLTEAQLERLVYCWALHATIDATVKDIDKRFGVPDGKSHLIGKDSVADYFRDFGDYLWVVEGYSFFVNLCNAIKGKWPLKEDEYSYPKIDRHIRDFLKHGYTLLTVDQPSEIGLSALASDLCSIMFMPNGGDNTRPITTSLAYTRDVTNGFSFERMHGYTARALLAGYPLEKSWKSIPLDKRDEVFRSSCLMIVPHMINKFKKYRLREPLPVGSFRWAKDGWTKY